MVTAPARQCAVGKPGYGQPIGGRVQDNDDGATDDGDGDKTGDDGDEGEPD